MLQPSLWLLSLRYMKGKVFIFLGNANLGVFRRFPGKVYYMDHMIACEALFSIPMSDGDWDWYNYSLVVLETSQSQRRDFKCTCLAAVHFNIWCAIGNMIHVVHSHLLKKEVHASLSLSLSLSLPPSLPLPSFFRHNYYLSTFFSPVHLFGACQ